MRQHPADRIEDLLIRQGRLLLTLADAVVESCESMKPETREKVRASYVELFDRVYP